MEFFSFCNGIPLHVSVKGNGPKNILFLHGYLETMYIWENFTDMISDGCKVISIDLPGHGLSGSHPQENSLEFSAVTIGQLMDKLALEKFSIVGHSMGGYVAAECAAKFPSRVESLILMHSLPFADTRQKKEERLHEIEIIAAGKLSEVVNKAVDKSYAPENLIICKEKIAETKIIAETHDPLGIIATLRGMINRPDNSSVIKNLQIPLLMFFGTKDNYITGEKALAAQSINKNTTAIYLENSGHNGFIEEQQLVLDSLNKFFKLTTKNC